MSAARDKRRGSEEPVALLARNTSNISFTSNDGKVPSEGVTGSGLIKTLSWHHLVGVTFFAVCGGDYGIEDSIGSGGVGFTLIGLCVLPWVWSLPIALMTAELSSMIPEPGGYVVWAHRAFGSFWATQNAVWNLVSNTFDNALYPVMFVDYLQWFPILRISGLLRWSISVLMLAVVTGLNLVGVDVVAQVSNLFAFLVISPFVALTVAGLAAQDIDPSVWAQGLGWETPGSPHLPSFLPVNSSTAPSVHPRAHGAGIGPSDEPIRWGTFLSVLLWNTSGYDSVGALAAEVHDPGRDFPRAMYATILLISLVYLIPLLVATTLDAPNLHAWSDGSFVRVASDHVGDWLAAWVTIGGALSCFGLLNTLLCTSARVAVSAAKLRVLPSAFARVHAASGTPRNATLLLSAVLAFACALPFSQLVSISMLFYGATTLVEFLALLALRIREPTTLRPFRIGLSGPPLVLFFAMPILICLTLMALAPYEAWLLFLASTVLGIAANARSSGAFASRHAAATWLRSCGRTGLCLDAWVHPASRHGDGSNGVAFGAVGAGGEGRSGGPAYQKGGRDGGGTRGRYNRVIGAHSAAELAGIELDAMGIELDTMGDEAGASDHLGDTFGGGDAHGGGVDPPNGQAAAAALAARTSRVSVVEAQTVSRRVSDRSSVSGRFSARGGDLEVDSARGEGGWDAACEDAADRSV